MNIHIVSLLMMQEEKKFEAVEKEYESVAELAKEDELELRYVQFRLVPLVRCTKLVISNLTFTLTVCGGNNGKFSEGSVEEEVNELRFSRRKC